MKIQAWFEDRTRSRQADERDVAGRAPHRGSRAHHAAFRQRRNLHAPRNPWLRLPGEYAMVVDRCRARLPGKKHKLRMEDERIIACIGRHASSRAALGRTRYGGS